MWKSERTQPDLSLTWPAIRRGTLPIRRILVVQTQRLGDVLCATPVLTALRHQFPGVHLTMAVRPGMETLLEGNPDLDELLTFDRRAVRRSPQRLLPILRALRRRRFDWALSIHCPDSLAFAILLAKIPWRTWVWWEKGGLRPHWARGFQQRIRQEREQGEKHEIEHNLDVLRQLGMEPRHEGYRLCLRPEESEWAPVWLRQQGRDESRPLAILHPGHAGQRQSWPAEQYARVGDGLAERGFQVAITGGGGERDLVARVAAGMRRPALQLAGTMSLRQLPAVLAQARLFVSVSTGPMHLASAVKVPAVTLYGPTDLRFEVMRWSPYRSPQRAVLSPVACTCPSSMRCTDAVCMRGITPEMVLTAADGLALDGAPGSSPSPSRDIQAPLRDRERDARAAPQV